ncbi:MAG: 3-deoxy-manno-octulosonate cytidylyltransferase [Phycisphaerales bacterium]
MQQAIAIIPARMGSTRFPGKVLAADTGHPLIWHVHERARAASCVSRVVVATESDDVVRAVEAFGGECVLTSPDHPNGASRLGEACELLGLSDDSIVVNVQGDEPELDPALIDCAVKTLIRTGAPVATIAAPFGDEEDPARPHIVKVVRRTDGSALYFSRSHIPYPRDPSPEARPLKHVGLYVYRRDFLRTYGTLAPTPLEKAEALEQLRMLEHGFSIAVAVREASHHGIDTPEDYRAFVARWRAADAGGGAGSAASA